ncbi:MAG: RidA family protein [Oscillospiraceae bacterium]|nr:RidA family protein [Oscillospiraceae bacterium]
MDIKRLGGNGRHSAAVEYGSLLFLSALTPDTLEPDIQKQAEEVLGRIERLLTLRGLDKSSLLCATIYLRDMNDFGAFNAVWDAWVTEEAEPARTCVQAAMPVEEHLVSIQVVAAI